MNLPASKPLDRQRAAAYARAAQVAAGAVALACLGLAAAALTGGDGIDRPPPSLPRVDGPAGPAALPDPAEAPVDSGAIAERLGMIANSPKPAPVAPVPDVAVAPVEPSSGPEPLRFLGVVRIGMDRLALVHDGRQRIVGVGETLRGETVIEITDDLLTLSKPGPSTETTEIRRAERSGSTVTRGAAPPTPAASPDGGREGRGFPQPNRPARPRRALTTIAPGGKIDVPLDGVPFTPGVAVSGGPTRARFEQIKERLRAAGRHTTENELNEAAAAALDEERGQAGRENGGGS